MKTPLHILILSTGGTIEKTYDEADGSLDNRGTVISKLVKEKLRLPHTTIEVRSIMSKDSLNMTEEDRVFICENIEESLRTKDHPIIVLHGTDTLMKTLEYCHQNLKNPKKPVIFTGAMKPVEFEKSDAMQNIIEATILTRVLEPGFYLAFHNNIYKAPNAVKNHNTMTFDPT